MKTPDHRDHVATVVRYSTDADRVKARLWIQTHEGRFLTTATVWIRYEDLSTWLNEVEKVRADEAQLELPW